MKAYVRTLIFFPIMFLITMMSWQTVAGKNFRPYYMYVPIFKFLYEKFSGVPQGRAQYPQALSMFINTENLRNLAIPPKMGGPANQTMYLLIGFSLLFSVILIFIPNSVFQFIGFLYGMSATFGFMLSCATYHNAGLFSMPFPTYLYVLFTILGLASIIVDPIRFIRMYLKDYRRME